MTRRHTRSTGSRLTSASASCEATQPPSTGFRLPSRPFRESRLTDRGPARLAAPVAEYGEKYRIFHHLESQVYLEEGFRDGPAPVRATGQSDEPEKIKV